METRQETPDGALLAEFLTGEPECAGCGHDLRAVSADRCPDCGAERAVVCPGCGYDLRGLSGGRCPECAEALCLRVALVEPIGRSFVIGLLGAAMGFGFHGLLIAFLLFRLAMDSRFTPDLSEIAPILIGCVVHGVVLASWLVWHGRFRRLPLVQKALLVGACWALTIASTMWVLVMLE